MKTINERITELMHGDYDPLRTDNLAETLANLTTEEVETIASLLSNHTRANGVRNLIGLYINSCSWLHWHKLAETQARCDEENERLAACERCHGQGCNSCNDLDDDRRTDNEN